MASSKTLDRLILADVLLAAISVAWSSRSAAPPPAGLTFATWILVCASTVAAWIGLLFRLKAARALYAASWAGYLAVVVLRGGSAASALGTVLDLATGLVGGMILALLYFTDLRDSLRSLGSASAPPLSADERISA